MKYRSCRGGVGRLSFTEAVLAGWSPEGGMILPDRIPAISHEVLQSWRHLSYPELSNELLQMFIEPDELPNFREIIDRGFSTFGSAAVVEMKKLSSPLSFGTGAPATLFILELFHGATLAFKDLGMQILCQTLQQLLAARKDRLCALVSTSGDTGPSAMAAIQQTPNLDVIVIYPRGRVSRVQEAQMLSIGAAAANCTVASAEGTSDDIDVPCGRVFEDAAFCAEHRLGSVNSINVLRLLGQVTHFFYAYFQLYKDHACWESNADAAASAASAAPAAAPTAGVPGAGGDGAKPLPTVSFSIPTGAAGHLTAGLIAKLMGLPVERFVVANNKNHVIDRMLREGVLQVSSFVHHTNSPAMDIAAPYNIERVLWLVDSQNGERVGEWMRAFNAGEAVRLPTSVMTAFAAHGVVSASVADGGPDGVLGCIRTIRRESGYLLDPHSAVGVAAAWKMAEEGLLHGPVVCMGCAHPAKFVETVAEALEIGPDEAATAVMDPDQPCVTAVIETTSGSFSADSVPLWKAGEDWTPLLKKMIVEVTERRATEAAAAPL